MVTKNYLMPSAERGQIKYWLILFIALALSVTLMLLPLTDVKIDSTNGMDEMSEILLLTPNSSEKDSCILDHDYWLSLRKQLENYSGVEASQLIFDKLRYKKDMGCEISDSLQQGILNYIQQRDQPTEIFENLFDIEGQVQNDVFQQQKYQDYQQRKKQLSHWVEDNIQPNESYEEVYSRELLLLQQEIFQ